MALKTGDGERFRAHCCIRGPGVVTADRSGMRPQPSQAPPVHRDGPGPSNHQELDRMATGTVKWFSDEKGFGFITPLRWLQGRVRPSQQYSGQRFQEPRRGSDRLVRYRAGSEGAQRHQRRARIDTPRAVQPGGKRRTAAFLDEFETMCTRERDCAAVPAVSGFQDSMDRDAIHGVWASANAGSVDPPVLLALCRLNGPNPA